MRVFFFFIFNRFIRQNSAIKKNYQPNRCHKVVYKSKCKKILYIIMKSKILNEFYRRDNYACVSVIPIRHTECIRLYRYNIIHTWRRVFQRYKYIPYA